MCQTAMGHGILTTYSVSDTIRTRLFTCTANLATFAGIASLALNVAATRAILMCRHVAVRSHVESLTPMRSIG